MNSKTETNLIQETNQISKNMVQNQKELQSHNQIIDQNLNESQLYRKKIYKTEKLLDGMNSAFGFFSRIFPWNWKKDKQIKNENQVLFTSNNINNDVHVDNQSDELLSAVVKQRKQAEKNLEEVKVGLDAIENLNYQVSKNEKIEKKIKSQMNKLKNT